MEILPKIMIVAAAIGWMAGSVSAQSTQSQKEEASSRSMTPEEMLQRRTERVEEFLRKLDTNGNGAIDADEIESGQKLLLERMIGATGELKHPLDIKQVLETHMKNYRAMVAPGGASGAADAKTAAKAESLPSAPAAAKPTKYRSAFSPTNETTPAVGRAAPASVAGPGSADGTKSRSVSRRKGIRFLMPDERLPKGLPDWFKARDLNGDGQIGMAEFAADWTPAKEAEFLRYDLNNDGVITPEECLRVEKASTGQRQEPRTEGR